MKYLLPMLLLLAGAFTLVGCMQGSSLTGGSIPIGDIEGNVYRDPAVKSRRITPGGPVPPAVVSLQVSLLTADGAPLRTAVTDARGYFLFHNVPVGTFQVVTLSAQLSARVDVDVETQRTVQVAMLLTNISSAVDDLDCMPVGATTPLAPGTPLQTKVGVDLSLTAVGHAGAISTPDMPVCWGEKGPGGSVTPAGVFHADQAGTYTLYVQYGPIRKVFTVQVLPA